MSPLLFAVWFLLPSAESDPYFAWRVAPPRDSAATVDRVVNAAFTEALRNVGPDSTCREAAAAMTAPTSTTAVYYFLGPVRRWGIDVVPHDPNEHELLQRWSIYRNAPLAPLGHAIPLDPIMNVDGVLFGTDKLGHFFTNGLRAYDVYRATRDRGGDEREALRASILLGVGEESGWLGAAVCGVFSYGDLYANMSGLRFYASLCDDGELALVDGAWRLTAPFRIARFVEPCWDESFAPSAFLPPERPAIDAALRETCSLLDDPRVSARRRAYAERGCSRAVANEIAALVRDGAAPDASRWSIDNVCGLK